MSVHILNKADCCGCTACASICPKQCIEMKMDCLGFKYPHVDSTNCVECGVCERVCPITNNECRDSSFEKPLVYALRVKDEVELSKSQSGGAFYIISEKFIDAGGVVYGACLDNEFVVRHKRASSKKDRDDLRYSKYVQSDLSGIFHAVKNDLKNGYNVLFTGTPCQVSGLRAYIGKTYKDNLTTVDLVCHAVPSPQIWQDYIKYIERRYKSKVISALFRDKKWGWSKCKETFWLSNNKILTRRTYDDLYFQLYTVRESCANCKFTNLNRVGDITIGDFWGWGKKHQEFDDDKGLSLVLINTIKGQNIFNDIKDFVHFAESSVTECLQPQLNTPIVLNPQRQNFIADYKAYGFEYVGKKYADLGLTSQIIQLLRDIKKGLLKCGK